MYINHDTISLIINNKSASLLLEKCNNKNENITVKKKVSVRVVFIRFYTEE